MEITIHIPDDLAQRLGVEGGDLSRRVLEALALDEFKLGHMTKHDLCRLLGFEVLDEFDGFLKAHGVYEPYTLADLASERLDLQRLGF